MSNERFSDEHLNAYIDGQLDAEEAGQVMMGLRETPSLSQQVCELRQVQDLVRHAYGDASLPESRSVLKNRRWPRYLQGAAAVLLLAVGAAAGWLAHGNNPAFLQGAYLTTAQSRPQNVILHISTDDPIKVSDALDQAELMLVRSKEKGNDFRLEIVANGDGLNLLRARYSSYPERTEELIHNYDNLAVMACARTLQAIKEQGGDVELLPSVNTTESALERVVDRLQDGWLYIRV
jgi:intracellular sulfur oxidation DsrE/DsrF family protein